MYVLVLQKYIYYIKLTADFILKFRIQLAVAVRLHRDDNLALHSQ